MNSKPALIRIVKVLLTLVVLYFLFRQVANNWSQIATYPWHLNWPLLLLGIVLGIAAFSLMAVGWNLIIAGFGRSMTNSWAFKTMYMSNLGRYVPGRIWQMFGMIYLARQRGVTVEEATASFFIFQLFSLPTSFLVFFGAGLIEPRISIEAVTKQGGSWITWLIVLALALVCVSIIMWPRFFLHIGNYFLRRFTKRPEVVWAMDKGVALKAAVLYVLAWLAYGLAFWVFLVAVVGDNAPGPWAAIGMFNGAYQIGYLAIFTPGGMGPRELVLVAMLSPFIGPIAGAVAILQRLWTIAIDAAAAALSVAIRK